MRMNRSIYITQGNDVTLVGDHGNKTRSFRTNVDQRITFSSYTYSAILINGKEIHYGKTKEPYDDCININPEVIGERIRCWLGEEMDNVDGLVRRLDNKADESG